MRSSTKQTRSARSRKAAATRARNRRSQRQRAARALESVAVERTGERTGETAQALPTAIVNQVARPTITCIEFADAMQVNIGADRFQTYAIVDGYAVRHLLVAVAERTGAIAVDQISHDHLRS